MQHCLRVQTILPMKICRHQTIHRASGLLYIICDLLCGKCHWGIGTPPKIHLPLNLASRCLASCSFTWLCNHSHTFQWLEKIILHSTVVKCYIQHQLYLVWIVSHKQDIIHTSGCTTEHSTDGGPETRFSHSEQCIIFIQLVTDCT